MWQVYASGQAEGSVIANKSRNGRVGLRLSYDFHGGGGFVAIRRVFEVTLPTTFEIGFHRRGDGPPNHFECKVTSLGGANVWRYLRQHDTLPSNWQNVRLNERNLPFAWGPAGGGSPARIEAIEFVIVAGPGGKGHLDLGEFHLLDQTFFQPVAIRASSESPQHPAAAAVALDAQEWRALSTDADPWWSMDIGRSQRFGGLIIEWPVLLPPRNYEVQVSIDGNLWQTLYRAECAQGALSHVPTPGAEARHLRLLFANASCASLRAIRLQPDSFSKTPNEFMHSVARDYPRGWYPRYWHREQSYWTPIGSPEGKRRALLNEEGMVEVDEASFSLEPFLLTNTGLLTWAEMNPSVALADDGMPMPCVTWHHSEFELKIQPWMDGAGEAMTLRVNYQLHFFTAAPHGLRLAITIRPFEVNPPWQASRNLGGCSAISQISLDENSLEIQNRSLFCDPIATAMGAARFEEGGVLSYLAQGLVPPIQHLTDASERASAVLLWDIPAGVESYQVTVSMPYFQTACVLDGKGQERAFALWCDTLGAVKWEVPACAQDAFDCWRTSAGYILINRDGPALQPGPRRYSRSWIRDCVIMGAALAKAGRPAPLREFIEWYVGFLRDDGFVPCIVDLDGIDWLVEHDSHGQFLWGIREAYRYKEDPEFLHKLLPQAIKVAHYLLRTRALRMTDFYRSKEQVSRFGLLPESASHEGYLAHPVHSYWDDFWGIRGLQACADLSEWAGQNEQATDLRNEAALFQTDVLRSMHRVIEEQNLNYLPGSVEWADFDPTATANAIGLLDFADDLPGIPMRAMLATYLDDFRRKHRGELYWNNYTAYEIRIIGALVRLGNREAAHELLDFFLSDRRPRAWNQWPEISWRDPRAPGHLGDIPHTWIAAEYMVALGSMVASEREATQSLVLACGLPWRWIAEESGFSVSELPTQFGLLHMKLHAPSEELVFVTIGDGIRIPRGGLFLQPPLPAGKCLAAVEVSAGYCEIADDAANSICIRQLPLRARLQFKPIEPLV